jgi:transposase
VDKESLEQLLGEGLSVERIAKWFGKDPSTVSYWMAKYGLKAPNRERYAAKGGIERGRLETLVGDGKTIAEIATEVGISKATVRYWLGRYGLRTQNGVGRRRPGKTRDTEPPSTATAMLQCARHGETEFILEGSGYHRCKRCRVESIARHRRKLKETLVLEAGGRCCICGYDHHVAALQFHHVRPSEKRFHVSGGGVTLSLEALRAEARKCVLLCANCHAEVENGAAILPVEFEPE